jgi:two-component system chemotaxis response regulator CheB
MNARKIRVLIVDDSLVFREVIARGIVADSQIEVVAKAADPFDARDKILAYKPDVMTCDIEMPKMNGIEFLRRLLPQYPIPVIVVSTISDAVFDAMNAGAVDFVTKPDTQSTKCVELFINDMIRKIKIAAKANLAKLVKPISATASFDGIDLNRIIAIGSSTGGIEALYDILNLLPSIMPGILIVQHIPPGFSRMFAERLNSQISLYVKEAANGDYVEPGKVLIAPGNQHMRIKRIGDRYKVEVFYGEKYNGHCPSVDILFDSVAKEAGDRAVGIILTGMGYDGAKGLLSMRRKGARTIGQDEKSSVVYGMPKVAYDIGAVEKQAEPQSIPILLSKILR